MNKSSYKLAGPISDHLIWTKLNQPNKRGTSRTHFRLTKVIPISFNKLATTHQDPISDPWEPPTKLWETKKNHSPKSELRVLGAVGSDNAPSPSSQKFKASHLQSILIHMNSYYELQSALWTPQSEPTFKNQFWYALGGPMKDHLLWS